MRLGRNLLLMAASLGVVGALGSINIDGLSLKPHGVKVKISKRDLPAEIKVHDKNTVPVEDSLLDATISGSSTKPPNLKSDAKTNSALVKALSDPSAEKKLSDATVISKSKNVQNNDDDNDSSSPPLNNSPFFMSVSMIIVSEIGDKTFLIAALMAMRHSRALVFSAAFGSLAVMTVLSGIVGHALPHLISQRVTQFLAAGLFLVFGFRLTREGLAMSKDMGVDEELAEVEEEITVGNINHDLQDIEVGGHRSNSESHKETTLQKYIRITVHYSNLVLAHVASPTWIQVFMMTFLGEWGDRSQIATIAMAAGSDMWPVIFGAVVGHGICTGGAVIGGKMLASRISMRTVTLGGAFAFILFSILYFYEAMYGESDA